MRRGQGGYQVLCIVWGLCRTNWSSCVDGSHDSDNTTYSSSGSSRRTYSVFLLLSRGTCAIIITVLALGNILYGGSFFFRAHKKCDAVDSMVHVQRVVMVWLWYPPSRLIVIYCQGHRLYKKKSIITCRGLSRLLFCVWVHKCIVGRFYDLIMNSFVRFFCFSISVRLIFLGKTRCRLGCLTQMNFWP